MRDIKIILVPPTATIKETMKVIDQGELKTALVVDDCRRLLGLVTDGDIRRGILNGLAIDDEISTVMNQRPVCASEGDPQTRVVGLLKSNPIIGLPILDAQMRVKDFALLSSSDSLHYYSGISRAKRHLDRILVLGGAGYIGSVVVRKLLAASYKVKVLEKCVYGAESLNGLDQTSSFSIVDGDTRHIEDIAAAMRGVDAVIHLAEVVGDPACAINPARTLETNYLATRMIGMLCKHFQINRLIYASSCSIYGASRDNRLLTEDSEPNPVSLYAKAKIASEKALLELRDENFLPTILRVATVFGFSYRPRFDLVVNLLTAKAVREGKITIFGGDQWRPNVAVSDIAGTILAALEAPIETVGGQVFNVGSERNNCTIQQIGELIQKEIPAASLVVDNSRVDRRDYKVDFSKLRNTLGLDMDVDIVDGIREVKAMLDNDPQLEYSASKYSNIKFLQDHALSP